MFLFQRKMPITFKFIVKATQKRTFILETIVQIRSFVLLPPFEYVASGIYVVFYRLHVIYKNVPLVILSHQKKEQKLQNRISSNYLMQGSQIIEAKNCCLLIALFQQVRILNINQILT